MAIRVFTRDQLYEELRKAGFQETQERTEHFTIWKNEKSEVISVNHALDQYPYYYLADLLHVVGIDYNFSGAPVEARVYEVTRRKP